MRYEKRECGTRTTLRAFGGLQSGLFSVETRIYISSNSNCGWMPSLVIFSRGQGTWITTTHETVETVNQGT